LPYDKLLSTYIGSKCKSLWRDTELSQLKVELSILKIGYLSTICRNFGETGLVELEDLRWDNLPVTIIQSLSAPCFLDA